MITSFIYYCALALGLLVGVVATALVAAFLLMSVTALACAWLNRHEASDHRVERPFPFVEAPTNPFERTQVPEGACRLDRRGACDDDVDVGV